jgi:hypothetical protein
VADEEVSATGEIASEIKGVLKSQHALVNEIVEHSRLARRSQQEAHAARQLVFTLSALVEHLRSHVAAVTNQRDRLVEQLNDQATQGAESDKLRQHLVQTQRYDDNFEQQRTLPSMRSGALRSTRRRQALKSRSSRTTGECSRA